LPFVHDARASLIHQPVTLTADLNHGRVMQQAIQHGGCQHSFTCAISPTPHQSVSPTHAAPQYKKTHLDLSGVSAYATKLAI
jgi:hypothetical protein